MYNMGSSYFMLENYDKGVEVLERAMKMQPKNIEWRIFLSQ